MEVLFVKKNVLFFLIVVLSITYILIYPVVSSQLVAYLFALMAILFMTLFLVLRKDRKRNRNIKIGLWITFGSVFLIPRFFFEPNMDFSAKVIWTVIVCGCIFYDASKEFKLFSN